MSYEWVYSAKFCNSEKPKRFFVYCAWIVQPFMVLSLDRLKILELLPFISVNRIFYIQMTCKQPWKSVFFLLHYGPFTNVVLFLIWNILIKTCPYSQKHKKKKKKTLLSTGPYLGNLQEYNSMISFPIIS